MTLITVEQLSQLSKAAVSCNNTPAINFLRWNETEGAFISAWHLEP